jgi:hypothetical protein
LGCLLAAATPAAASPYSEVVQPSGESKGIVVLFHGGGWAGGQNLVQEAHPVAQRLAQSGFTVWNVDYTSGAQSVNDAYAWYQLARANAGGKPTCVAGQSAGAHLALMVAGHDPSVSCVIAEAPPVDLPTVYDGGRGIAVQVFGEQNLAAMSPSNHLAASPYTRVLIANSDYDYLIPPGQAQAYKQARGGRTDVLTMPPGGDTTWDHAYTSWAGMSSLAQAELALLAQVAGEAAAGGGSTPSSPSSPSTPSTPSTPTAPSSPSTPSSPAGPDRRNPASDEGDSPGDDSLMVGAPVVNRRSGTATVPVEAGADGTVTLTGAGVKQRDKNVAAGEPDSVKIRPKARVARELKREGVALASVEITLSPGAGEPTTRSVGIRLIRR